MVNDDIYSWKPSNVTYNWLLRKRVHIDFIDNEIPEFILYWSAKNVHIKVLDSKFYQHIERKWKWYKDKRRVAALSMGDHDVLSPSYRFDKSFRLEQ